MSPQPESSSSHRKTAILLGLVAFLSFSYFYEGGGWNQNSRFDLLRAIVERHTLQIDAYHENTQDKAHVNGHYYSDKAPGLVFLAVPFALAARPALRMVGIDPESPRGEFALSYFVSLGAVGIADCAGGGVSVFSRLAIRRRRRWSCVCGAGDVSGDSAVGVCGIVLGACAGGGLPGFCVWGCVEAGRELECRRRLSLGTSGGIGRGMGDGDGISRSSGFGDAGVLGAVAGMVARFGDALASARGRGTGGRDLPGVLMGYLHAAFGAFRPSYSYYDPNSFSFMQQQGYLGLTYPHPDRLLKILFGCSRGLLFASPVLVGVPWGLWWLWKGKTHRAATLVAAGIAGYYFLFNASFYWWKAGLTFGPRYAGACIPFVCVGLAVVWGRATAGWRRVLLGLGACSIFLALMVVSTTSQLAMQDSCPIVHSTWRAFWSGQVALNRESMLTVAESNREYGAFNLGQVIGLRGLASLIPLFAIWGAGMVGWWQMRSAK